LEARNEALSTLSHYLNNAIMIISGQSQLISLMRDGNQVDKLMREIPSRTEEIRKSVDKIIAVMEVLKEVSPLSHDDYFNYSKALNIDDRIEERLKEIGAN
jgi:signal transduction histidine kinase